MRDVHGAAFFDDRLWVTCSYDDAVAVYDRARDGWESWSPLGAAAAGQDRHHLNSVDVWDDQRFVVVAHAHGSSTEHFFDRATRAPDHSLRLGHQAHDVLPVLPGQLVTCSSGRAELASDSGWALRTGGSPHGFARTDDAFFLGLSSRSTRAERAEQSPVLRCYDPQWRSRGDLRSQPAWQRSRVASLGSDG